MQWIFNLFMDWVWSRAKSWLLALLAKFKRRDEIKKEEEISVDPLKKANPDSEKEIDDATRSALDGL